MISFRLRHLLFDSKKFLLRNLRSPRKTTSNPGLTSRLKAYEEDGVNVSESNVDEYMDDSESDFYDVGASYKKVKEDLFKHQDKVKSAIVARKYFKQKLPNLLTWSEKEQIRHLASSEPETWTPQHIAECFPCTEYAAKRLIRNIWKPESEKEISRHDASVLKNWRELKSGNLQIPTQLKEHLMKFSDRTVSPPKIVDKKMNDTPTPTEVRKIGQFEEIVSNCISVSTEQKLITNNSIDKANNELSISLTKKGKKNPKKITSEMTTLDELAANIRQCEVNQNSIDITDKIIIDSIKTNENSMLQYTNNIDIQPIAPESPSNPLQSIVEDTKVTFYREKIYIPKAAYQKGATYKVRDCFYDDDGKFLYRVLGMTGVGSG